MKSIKTKIMTAMMLAAVSFGMFSFTTSPVVAQETSSIISAEASAEEMASIWTRLGKAFVKGIVAGAGLEWLVGGSGDSKFEPADALDQ